MTMQILVATIATICKFNDPNISREQKELCMEKIVNCAIVKDGKTSYKLLKECQNK